MTPSLRSRIARRAEAWVPPCGRDNRSRQSFAGPAAAPGRPGKRARFHTPKLRRILAPGGCAASYQNPESHRSHRAGGTVSPQARLDRRGSWPLRTFALRRGSRLASRREQRVGVRESESAPAPRVGPAAFRSRCRARGDHYTTIARLKKRCRKKRRARAGGAAAAAIHSILLRRPQIAASSELSQLDPSARGCQ